MMGHKGEINNIGFTIFMIIGFGLFMLIIGRYVINKTLPWIQQKLSWPGGVLSISLGLCFLGAAFTQYIGLHAILGAFIVGIAFGDSVHLQDREREIIYQFVTNIFAPLFFISIGLRIGGYMGGLTKRESLAVGFGLNARGAMEIILGTLALNVGLIDNKMFVALVVMALITSMMSAPLIKRFID